jgi:eukaryotic-like serine/threonine-protein kinase
MIGQTFSHYEILEKLGEGGMGVVYKAHDSKLKRTVALKFLPTHVSASEQDKARFIQEAQSASALNHPNVCTIHDIQEYDSQLFIVMEFVEGRTLGDLLEKGPPSLSPLGKGGLQGGLSSDRKTPKAGIQLKQAIDIGMQIADGLAAAHENGIVHRDIKPDNIMVRKDGRVIIMDFGLAKLKGDVSRLTKEGSTVGTAGYMSPEQVQGHDVDHRSDIFSLGVVLYELFTGELPFKGVHETALIYEIVNVDPVPMSSVKPEIDAGLDGIVLECLQKDPAERYQSVAEVAKELRRFKRESSRQRVSRISGVKPVQEGVMDSGSYGSSSTISTYPPPTVSPRRERILLASAGVLLVLLLISGYMHLNRSVPEVEQYRYTIAPPEGTSFNNFVGGHTILSPDGTKLVFLASESGENSLWVRSLDELTARKLPGTVGAFYPFWSPDSRWVGFFADGRLKRIDVSGGSPITVTNAEDGRGGTWNEAGIIIFSPASTSSRLYKVPASGGEPSPVTFDEEESGTAGHRFPSFLPDGNHFTYLREGGGAGVYNLYVSALDGKTDKLLLENVSSAQYVSGHLLYIRDTNLFAHPFDTKRLRFNGDAFLVAESIVYAPLRGKGVLTLSHTGNLIYQVDRAGTDQSVLSWLEKINGEQTIIETGPFWNLSFSPDGRYAAVSVEDRASRKRDIWIYDLERSVRTRFTFGENDDFVPVWSPDGRYIVFESLRDDGYNIVLRESGGGGEERILHRSAFPMRPTDWSADGKLLLISSQGESQYGQSLYILPFDNPEDVHPFLRRSFMEFGGKFSPDGKWVAYQSNQSGRQEIYIRPTTGSGGVRQVSTDSGVLPEWSRDGKELFFYDFLEGRLMSASVKTDDNSIDIGTILPLFNFRPRFALNSYNISQDGKRFLAITSPDQEADPGELTVVLNWDRGIR